MTQASEKDRKHRGSYYTPADRIEMVPGLSKSAGTWAWTDRYAGSADAIAASGLVPRELLPGGPGMPVSCARYRPSGVAAPRNGWLHEPGYIQIFANHCGTFRVELTVSLLEQRRRQVQDQRKREAAAAEDRERAAVERAEQAREEQDRAAALAPELARQRAALPADEWRRVARLNVSVFGASVSSFARGARDPVYGKFQLGQAEQKRLQNLLRDVDALFAGGAIACSDSTPDEPSALPNAGLAARPPVRATLRLIDCAK